MKSLFSILTVLTLTFTGASRTVLAQTTGSDPLNWKPSSPPRPLTAEEHAYEGQIQSSYQHLGLKKSQYKAGDKIAIIGAGIAGLSIARNLINKGVPGENITVFEERHLPGGKTRGISLEDDKQNLRHYELGAAVIIPGRYKLIEDLIQKHGLSTRPLDPPTFFNVKDGSTLADPTEDEKLELKKQAGYYLGLFKANPSWLSISSPDGYRNVPDELEVTWNEFLNKHGSNFDRLNQRLAVALGGSGFLMSQNPPFAAQVVRFINPAFLIPILTPGQGSRMFNELSGPCISGTASKQAQDINGFQCLWIREAQELASKFKVNFQYGTRIAKIRRGSSVVLSLMKQERTENEAHEQVGYDNIPFKQLGRARFNHVFYTGDMRYLTRSPWIPEGQALREKGILDRPLASEKALYDSIEIYPYKSYLVKLRNFPIAAKEGFFALLPQIQSGDKNRAVLMMRTYKDTDVFQVWGYGTRANESTEEFLTVFREDMRKVGVSFDIKTDVLVKSDWDYFPHATPKSGKTIKEFFNNIMARQGMGGLWYSSEVMGFGLTIEAYEQGKAFSEWFVDGKL